MTIKGAVLYYPGIFYSSFVNYFPAKIGQPKYFDKLTEKCKIPPPGRI